MGRPTKLNPVRTGTSRREFFRRSGAATVGIAAAGPLLPLATEAAAVGVFRHGVASGDPLSDRVILWTRVTLTANKPTLLVTYVVASDPGLRNVVLRGTATTSAARDFTVKVDAGLLRPSDAAGQLRPDTSYYYQFTAGGELSPVGRTKTLTDTRALCLGLGGQGSAVPGHAGPVPQAPPDRRPRALFIFSPIPLSSPVQTNPGVCA